MLPEQMAQIEPYFPLSHGVPRVESWFSGCLRLDDLDGFYDVCRATGMPEQTTGWPRLHAPKVQLWGGRMAALIDPDGSLLRLVQN